MLFTCGTPNEFITHVYVCTYTEYIHGIFYVYLDTDTSFYTTTHLGRFPTDPTRRFWPRNPFPLEVRRGPGALGALAKSLEVSWIDHPPIVGGHVT